MITVFNEPLFLPVSNLTHAFLSRSTWCDTNERNVPPSHRVYSFFVINVVWGSEWKILAFGNLSRCVSWTTAARRSSCISMCTNPGKVAREDSRPSPWRVFWRLYFFHRRRHKPKKKRGRLNRYRSTRLVRHSRSTERGGWRCSTRATYTRAVPYGPDIGGSCTSTRRKCGQTLVATGFERRALNTRTDELRQV